MRTLHVLLFAGGVSLAAMSFRPVSDVDKELLGNKVATSKFSPSLSTSISTTGKAAITPLVAIALAESSYLATAAATAAAYNWLFGFTARPRTLSGSYKSVIKDVDMRNLDNPRL